MATRMVMIAVISLLCGFGLSIAAQRTQSNRVFYVTFPYAIPALTAIKVSGVDRLDAYTRLSATVWEEGDWRACIACKKSKVMNWPPPER